MCLVPRQRLGVRVNSTVVVTAFVVTLLDAATKVWARHALSGHARRVFGGIWLRLQYNSGMSFSLNRSGPLVTTVLAVVVLLIVLVVALRAQTGTPSVGFGLLIGGGLANVIDRLAASPHRVTDFIAVGSFPVFNLADAAITIGFVVLLVATLRGERLLRQ